MTLEVYRGATFRLAVRYKTADGQPIDLTDCSATFRVLSFSDGEEIFSFVATVSTDGWIRLTVSDEDTKTWPLGNHAFRLELDYPSGEKDYLLIDSLKVDRGY